MRTSLNEIKEIEDHLFSHAPPEDALVFEARLILHPILREKVRWQQKTYRLIRKYGRRQLKAEIEAVHQKLFQEPAHESFRQKIFRLFSNH